MDPDIIFTAGFVLCVLSIPAIVSAILDGRAPRVAAITVLTGALMISFAIIEQPTAYTFDALPDVFVRVAAKVLN